MASLVALLALTAPVLGHMQMTWPYPLHSTFNPATPEDIKDYSMTNPLGQYPCKGYINNPASDMFSVASWSAGSTINFTLAGSATHGGGSCQMSLSYDEGKTWSVIESYMGGCPIDSLTYQTTIPTDAPSGEALFSWSWFNLIGNREMYQNCAVVNITGGGSGLSDITKYPAPFVANVDAAPDCHTVEGTSVVFPNPGANVVYGGEYKDTKPTTPAGFTGSCGSTGTSSNSSDTSGSSTSSVSVSSSTDIAVSSPTPSVSTGAGSGATGSTSASSSTETSTSDDAGDEDLADSQGSGTINLTTNTSCSSTKRSKVAKRHERLMKKKHSHEELVELAMRGAITW